MSADTDQSHEVALMQQGDDAPLPQRRQIGLNHMAWRVASLDDIADYYRRIKAQGQPIDRVADHGISLGIYRSAKRICLRSDGEFVYTSDSTRPEKRLFCNFK